ncbi:MAG: lasso peptide biosynthesis B2 protein [Rhodospirillaceae bacterium]
MNSRLAERLALLPLVLEAVGWLLFGWLILRLLPFCLVAGRLRPGLARSRTDPDIIPRIARAVRVAARRVPWPAVCFTQGIAAQRMLCRRGVAATLCYGVRNGAGGGLEAHVWVTVGDGRSIVGGEAASGFSLLATFEPRPSPDKSSRG